MAQQEVVPGAESVAKYNATNIPLDALLALMDERLHALTEQRPIRKEFVLRLQYGPHPTNSESSFRMSVLRERAMVHIWDADNNYHVVLHLLEMDDEQVKRLFPRYADPEFQSLVSLSDELVRIKLLLCSHEYPTEAVLFDVELLVAKMRTVRAHRALDSVEFVSQQSRQVAACIDGLSQYANAMVRIGQLRVMVAECIEDSALAGQQSHHAV
jgi:hypothetical protein